MKLYWQRDTDDRFILRPAPAAALAIVYRRGNGKWGWMGTILAPGMPSGGAYLRPSDAAEWVRRNLDLPGVRFDKLPKEMTND